MSEELIGSEFQRLLDSWDKQEAEFNETADKERKAGGYLDASISGMAASVLRMCRRQLKAALRLESIAKSRVAQQRPSECLKTIFGDPAPTDEVAMCNACPLREKQKQGREQA